MVEHSTYLEFRIPSGLDDDFNVYKNAAKLDFSMSLKQKRPLQKSRISDKSSFSSRSLASQPTCKKEENNSEVFFFNKSLESPVNIGKYSYPSRKPNKSWNQKSFQSSRTDERKDFTDHLLHGGAHSVRNGAEIVPYKFNPQPILKAYPGKDPGHLKVTTNSRSATTMTTSTEVFEFAPNDRADTGRHRESASSNTPASKSTTALSLSAPENSNNNSSSYASYPLSRHSYTTAQPPWVNKVKIRKSREPVNQIMTQSTQPVSVYRLSPTAIVPPPANSTEPPVDQNTSEKNQEFINQE